VQSGEFTSTQWIAAGGNGNWELLQTGDGWEKIAKLFFGPMQHSRPGSTGRSIGGKKGGAPEKSGGNTETDPQQGRFARVAFVAKL
jgi:hypothetical protein